MDRSTSPPSTVEPEQAYIETTTRLVKRSETAESAAIFGGSNVYIEPGGLSAEVSVMSERTRITSRNDGGREYERVYLKSRCACPDGEEHTCGQPGFVDVETRDSMDLPMVVPYRYPETEEETDAETTDSQPFLPVVEHALVEARVLSAVGPSNWFIPCTELVRIVKKETVARLLVECAPSPLSEEYRMELAEKICPSDDTMPSYKHILATLILVGKPTAIMDFVNNRIDDDKLPLEMTMVANKPHVLCVRDRATGRTESVTFTRDWSKKHIADFSRIQWETEPLFFSTDGDKIVHYKCRPGEILPFVHKETGYESGQNSPTSTHSSPIDQRPGRTDTRLTKDSKTSKSSSNKSSDPDMEGGFGKVFIYRLHPSQQSLKRYTVEGPSRLVAVKKLHSTSRAEFNQEYKMLVKLTPLPTPHLAKLLATYEVPHGPQNSKSKEFFLMFECADSNLRKFWREPPPIHLSKGYVARWVADQCRGLADALGRIHRFEYPIATDADATAEANGSLASTGRPTLRKEPSRRHTRTHGFHGDLKPDNILRYCGWKIPPHAMPGTYSQQAEDHPEIVLQRQTSISQRTNTDSGNSSSGRSSGQAIDPLGVLQITDFGLSSFHHTETAADIKAKLLSHPYRPPESQLIMKTTQSLDTWTLGCLFLDFLTWLVEGPAGIDAFEDVRVSPGLAVSKEVYFYDLTESNGSTTVSVSAGVLQWVEKLCTSPKSSQFVCDFAELIMRHMLVIEDTEGKFSDSSVGQDPYFPTKRIEAKKLAADMMTFIGREDWYYESVKSKPDLMKHHERRHVIRIQSTFQQLRTQVREGHQ
jgi:serine/threonine protein kinase